MKDETELASATEAAARAGFDINLIECNLALTVEERWRQHSLALDMALELQNARKNRGARRRSQKGSFR